MPEVKIRKSVITIDEIFHEGGPVAAVPLRRGAVCTVIENPFAGRYVEEIVSFIDDLNVDEQVQLVALAWLGRGDYSLKEWNAAVAAARERQTGSTARYLLGIPILADLLEEGLSQHGQSCEDFERGHL